MTEKKRVTGIEPVPSPWQGGILPLDHTRNYVKKITKLLI
jgi:hypothetical protein